MANNEGEGKKTAPLDPKIADRLLDLLSTDDGFRELFAKDPKAALGQVGYQADATVAARGENAAEALASSDGCCKVSALASKEVILEARDAIRSMLTSNMSQIIPQLDSGLDTDRRTLK